MPVETATRVAGWLKSRQMGPRGRILDSVHQGPGTYADGFAALTFALLDWTEPLAKALQVTLARPLESEFDSLAQALILKLAPTALGVARAEQIRAKGLYQGSQLVSNNWALFRALTRELHGEMGDFSLLQRQFPSGLIPDSPIGQATPTCYHAKICAVLALRARLCGPGDAGTLRKALEALLVLVSPQGVLVPYGRSRNTLFGYGSAYLALRLGAAMLEDGRYSWGARRVLEYVRRHQADDGHIPASLNEKEWLREDWDIYINNPDYNAFAAACLMLAARLAPEIPDPVPPEDGEYDLGPLLAVRSQGSFFACSLSGEFAPFGSPFFCDTRYAGLAPLLFDDSRYLRIFERNYCWDGRDRTRAALADPLISDWIPFLNWGNRRYWVREFNQVDWTWKERVLNVRGGGKPSHGAPRRAWQRFLDSKLWKRPARQMDLLFLPDELTTHLQLDFSTRRLCLSSACAHPAMVRSHLEEVLCPT